MPSIVKVRMYARNTIHGYPADMDIMEGLILDSWTKYCTADYRVMWLADAS